MTRPDKPAIDYPCRWTYKVVGTDEEDLRRAVKVMLGVCLDRGGDRTFELGISRTSSAGTYTSLNLTLEVASEEERNALYAGLKDCPEVRMVL
jgi:putative lipoic acid-binding regulatory protein